jgi:hypothetical protein
LLGEARHKRGRPVHEADDEVEGHGSDREAAHGDARVDCPAPHVLQHRRLQRRFAVLMTAARARWMVRVAIIFLPVAPVAMVVLMVAVAAVFDDVIALATAAAARAVIVDAHRVHEVVV